MISSDASDERADWRAGYPFLLTDNRWLRLIDIKLTHTVLIDSTKVNRRPFLLAAPAPSRD
jgi:hypothetical protein